ncbi:alpha/beta hydrolase [Monashia sp. NPDC004114]
MATISIQKSTNVRSVSRWTFRTLEVLAPALGAWIAERSWFRLPGSAHRVAGIDRPAIRELLGAPFEVELRGRTVRGWVWGSGPVAYLVHGWGGTGEQLTPLVAPLLDRGFTVVAFDGLSHGHSDPGEHGPSSSDAIELGRSLDAVAARFGPARVVVAHSMGALSAVLALRDGWLTTERLVLIAPAPGIPALLGRFREELGFGGRTERRLVRRAERRTGYPVDGLDVAVVARQIDRPDLLVVHDLLDREADHAASVELVRGWPGAELISTAGLGHRRVLADAAVAGALSRFADRLPVEPTLHGEDRPAPFPRAADPADAATGSSQRAAVA